MQYLSLENVTKSYGDKILFQDISFSISKGDKIALVAKNGSGKTSLLRLIAGEESAEGEQALLQVAKDIRIAYLRQEPELDDRMSVLDAVLDSDNESINAILQYENAVLVKDSVAMQAAVSRLEDLKAWNIETRIKEILTKLKITDYQQKVGELSGGQKKRLALAKILIDEPEFIILDEPTNHLDLDMIEWLEQYLQHPGLTILMVTHDRYFLERICNEIIELDGGSIFIYRGNYSEYLEKKSARMLNQATNLEKTKKLYSKELQWIRRQPKARSTKAKSRVDNFQEIKEKAHIKLDDDNLSINILPERMGSKILEAHAMNKSFGDRTIVDSFSYKFKKGEKVGIVGPNGAGKTTFLKLLTKELRPDGGKVIIGDTIVFGHYSQDGIQIKEDKTVIDVIRDIAEYIPLEKGKKMSAETLLERFMFPRFQQRVFVSQLSGGEKRRLYLLTVLMANPNFLILDEPTNDLDILTLNVLENYLMEFPGCLIMVSHDRYFMDKLVDHLFVLEGDGKVIDYNGNYSEFRAERSKESKTTTVIPSNEKPKSENFEEKPKVSYEQKKRFNRLEKEIEKLELRKKEITEGFNQTDISTDEIQRLSIALGQLNGELDEKENEWLEMSTLF